MTVTMLNAMCAVMAGPSRPERWARIPAVRAASSNELRVRVELCRLEALGFQTVMNRPAAVMSGLLLGADDTVVDLDLLEIIH